eukprot:9268177-Lingulodinium_polyedra.AAC.1
MTPSASLSSHGCGLCCIDHDSGMLNSVACIHIYTDGSFDGVASWGVVVIAEIGTKCFRYIARFGGLVETDPAHNQWVGADSHDNYTAELTAMVMAVAWIAQLQHHCSCCIHYDALSAAAKAQVGVAAKQQCLVGMVAMLIDTVSTRACVEWQH